MKKYNEIKIIIQNITIFITNIIIKNILPIYKSLNKFEFYKKY